MKTSAGSFLERHEKQIAGVLGCYDRIVMTGTLLDVAYPAAVQNLLYERRLRCFEIGQFAEPLREAVRENAQSVTEAAGLEIEYPDPQGARKGDRIAAILEKRGHHPRLVQIFSAMENCRTFKPWRENATGQTKLRVMPGRCLHYSFYLIDEELGLCFVRVPTHSAALRAGSGFLSGCRSISISTSGWRGNLRRWAAGSFILYASALKASPEVRTTSMPRMLACMFRSRLIPCAITCGGRDSCVRA